MWSEDLLDDQAVAAGTERKHTVLLAGPGTGKTFVLVRRVQYLIEELGVSPGRILALTFSRAAAAEMRERLEERLGAVGKLVRVSTLHAFSLGKLLRSGSGQLPVPIRVAGDWEERWIVVEELAYLMGKNAAAISNHRDGYLDRLSDDWDTLDVDGEGWKEGFPDPKFLTVLQRHRWIYGYTLRSELVYQLLAELRANPDFDLGGIDELLVDEYQDLNRCDLDTVAILAERAGAHLFAAGDDDQSIYSFRHAVPAGIRSFGEAYSGSSRMTLSQCLRCGEDVVALANWLIAQDIDREDKELVSVTSWDASVHLLRFPNQAAEAAALARTIQVDIAEGTKPQQILILARSDTAKRMSSAITAALGKYDIEVYLPRAVTIDSREVQRVLEYLVLARSLKDDRVDDLAVRALLELEDNGIGGTRIGRVMQASFDASTRFYETLESIRSQPDQFASNLQPVVAAFDGIIHQATELQARPGESFDEWLVRLSNELALPEEIFARLVEVSRTVAGAEGLELLELEPVEAPEEGEGTEPIEGSSDTDSAATVDDYVQALVEAMGSLSDVMPARMPGKVTFTTMHGAKGLTADIVYVLQVEDEVIPGDAIGHEFDESRRLLYVSLTRARKRLVVCACTFRTGPQRFSGGSESERRHLSRFLKDYGLKAQTIATYLADRESN
jgi:DNA helicase-2/ATP-dependent DNA helicase PcrA